MQAIFRSRAFQTTLGLGVSIAILIWLFWTIRWKLVLHELKTVHYWAFIPYTLLFTLQMGLRGWRWRTLLPPHEHIPPMRYVDGVMIGNFINYILPLRLGEIARPYFLTQQSSLRFPSTFVSVLIERFFDLATVLISFGIMSFYVSGLKPWVYKGALILSSISIAIFAFMLLAGLLPQQLKTIASFFLKPLPQTIQTPLHRFLDDFIAGAGVLNHPSNLLRVLALSILIWLVIFAQQSAMLLLFDFPFTYWHGVGITVIIAISVAAPSAPGFLGVYQAACLAGFLLFGFSKEHAATYAILSHLLQYLLIISYGIFLLNRYGLSLRDLKKPT